MSLIPEQQQKKPVERTKLQEALHLGLGGSRLSPGSYQHFVFQMDGRNTARVYSSTGGPNREVAKVTCDPKTGHVFLTKAAGVDAREYATLKHEVQTGIKRYGAQQGGYKKYKRAA